MAVPGGRVRSLATTICLVGSVDQLGQEVRPESTQRDPENCDSTFTEVVGEGVFYEEFGGDSGGDWDGQS